MTHETEENQPKNNLTETWVRKTIHRPDITSNIRSGWEMRCLGLIIVLEETAHDLKRTMTPVF